MPSHISEMTIVATLLIVLLRSGGVAWTSGPDAEGDRDAVSSTPRGAVVPASRPLQEEVCAVPRGRGRSLPPGAPTIYLFWLRRNYTPLEAWCLVPVAQSCAHQESLCRSPQGIIGVGYLSLP